MRAARGRDLDRRGRRVPSVEHERTRGPGARARRDRAGREGARDEGDRALGTDARPPHVGRRRRVAVESRGAGPVRMHGEEREAALSLRRAGLPGGIEDAPVGEEGGIELEGGAERDPRRGAAIVRRHEQRPRALQARQRRGVGHGHREHEATVGQPRGRRRVRGAGGHGAAVGPVGRTRPHAPRVRRRATPHERDARGVRGDAGVARRRKARTEVHRRDARCRDRRRVEPEEPRTVGQPDDLVGHGCAPRRDGHEPRGRWRRRGHERPGLASPAGDRAHRAAQDERCRAHPEGVPVRLHRTVS